MGPIRIMNTTVQFAASESALLALVEAHDDIVIVSSQTCHPLVYPKRWVQWCQSMLPEWETLQLDQCLCRLVHPDEREAFQPWLQSFMQNEDVQRIEHIWRMLQADQSVLWSRLIVQKQHGQLIVHLQDVSEHQLLQQRFEQLQHKYDCLFQQSKQAEAALKDTMSQILQSTGEGIFVIEPGGAIGFVNQAALVLTGYESQPKLFGFQLYETNAKGQGQALDPLLLEKRLQLGESRIQGESSLIHCDGHEISIEYCAAPLHGKAGAEGVVVVIRDISERLKAHKLMLNAKEQAEQTSKMKSEFIANISHELRTPLNAILGLTQLCRSTVLNEQQQDYLDKIYRSSTSLLGIINSILDFSELESGHIRLESNEFSLHDLLTSLASTYSLSCEEKGLELYFDNNPLTLCMLKGDVVRIEQVLQNLISNAIKFTDQGHVLVNASVRSLTEQQVRLEVSVKDSGIGFEEQHLQQLFDAFAQQDGSFSRKFQGIGLGLAMCQKLMHLMQGDISVSSEQGQGSCFTVSFPLLVSSDVLLDEPQLLKSLCALEPSLLGQQVLQSQLDSFGFENYQVVCSEAELLTHLKQREVDIVLLDDQISLAQLPGLAKSIKRLEPDVLVIAKVSLSRQHMLATDTYIDGCLIKPYSPVQLLHLLTHFVPRLKIQKSVEPIVRNMVFEADKQLDKSMIMSQINFNLPFVQKLVKTYIVEFQDIGAQLNLALEQNATERGLALLNALKGVTMNVGMPRLHLAAKMMFNWLSEHQLALFESHLEQFEQCIKASIQAAYDFLLSEQLSEVSGAQLRLLTALQQLQQLLIQHKAVQPELIAEIEFSLPSQYTTYFVEVKQHLNQWNYLKALRQLNRLLLEMLPLKSAAY